MEGNYIGTNADGTQPIINAGNGVEISFSGDNTIGGTTPESRNLISGNADGVLITNLSNDNLVEGNYIGTNADGTQPIINSGNGVEIGFRITTRSAALRPSPATSSRATPTAS